MGHLNRRAQRVSMLAVALTLLASAPALAADEAPGWSYRMAGELMSPFCPGRALSDCPSPNAAEMREWIVSQEEAGVSRTAVEEQLFSAWGDQLLQAPRAEGLGLLAYIIPAVAGLLGALIVFAFLRRQVRARERSGPDAPEPMATAPPELSSELDRLVDAELARRG